MYRLAKCSSYRRASATLNHNVDGIRWADIVARWQITLARYRHGQPIKRDNFAPRQPIGEVRFLWSCKFVTHRRASNTF
jgi:hypothetical protein